MKKLITQGLCIVLLMATVGCSNQSKQASASFYQEDVKKYIEAIDMDYAYQLTETLSTDTSMHDNALGFRTSGSDAENRAAEFIAKEMEKIGLQNVEMEPITVDKWQFNGASLTLKDSDLSLEPVSYMVSGTDKDGITAEIVDVGTGFKEDYEGIDVNGKIVLCGVDQYNESWIDGYIYEAQQHGAIALVTYDLDGYGRYSDDNHQIQDVCCEDVMPTVIITANEYKQLKEELDKGNTICTLTVDSEMEIDGGTSYNVVGYIPGKSHDQQIIFAGHYDMYFTGFQDDCSAISAAMSMAKAMIDSGYVPENDIVVVAHGAEEWGASGTEFDWTRGAYECIYNTHPEWASKTLAMFNFELCAFDDGSDTFAITCVPEYSSFVKEMVENGTLDEAVKDFKNGVLADTYDTSTMEDGVTYRGAGVPYFLNTTDTCVDTELEEGTYSWTQLHYHTESDDTSTYDEKTMKGNIGVYGALAIVIDQLPVIQLDFTRTVADLKDTYLESYASEALVDNKQWEQAVEAFETYAEELKKEGEEITERFVGAKTDEEREAIREEGKAYSQKALDVFKQVQDALVGIEFSSNIVIKHEGYINNLIILDGIISALENGELTNDDGTGALDLAYQLNALCEYNYYLFSYDAAKSIDNHADASLNGNKWWGNDKGYVFTNTGKATQALLEKEDDDYTEELKIYQSARDIQLDCLRETIESEIAGLQAIVE